MKIIIDIPEQLYETYKGRPPMLGDAGMDMIAQSIANGTPLPKGHGRLIDADQLMNYCQNQIDGHKYADCNVIARFPIVLDAEVEHDD